MSDGGVFYRDALEIREMLHNAKSQGNRFVSFELGKEDLKKEDFTVFETAFDAHQHAYDNSTDLDIYVVRSIHSVERGIDSILNNKESHLLIAMQKEIRQMLEIVEGIQQKKSSENISEMKLNDGQLSR